jgi:hypothetical protein
LRQVLRFVLAVLFAVLLAGCAPNLFGPDDRLGISQASPGAFHAVAKAGPTLILTSSKAISMWKPLEACSILDRIKGEVTALKCPAPVEVAFSSEGSVSGQIVNGIVPVTSLIFPTSPGP